MRLIPLSLLFSFFLLANCISAQPKPAHDLQYTELPQRWDEGLPVGNGWLGALIWQKEEKLRLSLDRVDLWDDRPMPEIDKLTFDWVVEKWKKNQYDSVQRLGDEPYEKYPAPTKIPGAAIEFDMGPLGSLRSGRLNISNGLASLEFKNGIRFNVYVHANRQVGYFSFESCPADMIPALMIPNYNTGNSAKAGSSSEGQGLESLGYVKGTVTQTGNSIRYRQPTLNGHFYEVLVQWWKRPGSRIIGQWTITNDQLAVMTAPDFTTKEPTHWDTHLAWWKDYWKRSAISVPDQAIERQYYLDMYKFGSVARSNTPPISLQAIWTADNGSLPPWKGDFHHDLNTQLSYWPGYASNHIDLTAGYTNWLLKVRKENERWTKQYFGLPGLNVPGVTTISGRPMGGWIQYSLGPTTAAWLAQHFYWQAVHSMKRTDYEQALNYLTAVETFLYAYLEKAATTKGFIALSSSPEFFNNERRAWFDRITNFDKSLIKYVRAARQQLIGRFNQFMPPSVYAENDPIKALGELDQDASGLTVAPGQPLDQSHRHHSPFMAIYPLCLLDVDRPEDKELIKRSLRTIERSTTREWCGYSFSWMSCIYARSREADSAVSMLQKFVSNFVSPNSFHLNGDQRGGQYSSNRSNPFTLEGNFAFAQGVHELLLQTRQGIIEVFPALPDSWKDVSFRTLRAEGAFLVSAVKENGKVKEVVVKSEAGGTCLLRLPFTNWTVTGIDKNKVKVRDGVMMVAMGKGQEVRVSGEW